LTVVVLAHSRLLGLLHHRLGPGEARPLAAGPDLGTHLTRLVGRSLDGGDWRWEFPAPTDLLVVFVSPQCSACNELLPHVKDFIAAHRGLQVALFSTLDHLPMTQAYVAYRRLEHTLYLIGRQLADELNVDGTPYALYVNREGVVTAKGVVNHYEHLLSLTRPAADNRNGQAEVVVASAPRGDAYEQATRT
jgi:methylamine dehydrogenase accessory protein MauD